MLWPSSGCFDVLRSITLQNLSSDFTEANALLCNKSIILTCVVDDKCVTESENVRGKNIEGVAACR